MANTYNQVHIQVVFAVKYRKAVLEKEWRETVFGVMGNLINETGCKTLIVNGVEDHVHCLIGLKPSISISDLMQIVKSNSSKFINDNKFLLTDKIQPHLDSHIFQIIFNIALKYIFYCNFI